MSKIPEGTQYIEAGCGEKGFRKYEKGHWWFFEGFWRHVDWTMRDLRPVTEHPFYIDPAANWTGEGLPPAGTVCEYRRIHHHATWRAATILCVGEKRIFFRDYEGDELSRAQSEVEFRPIRTAEQIATDERLHKVRNALSSISGLDEWNVNAEASAAIRATVEAMIDAGYRKEPTQ